MWLSAKAMMAMLEGGPCPLLTYLLTPFSRQSRENTLAPPLHPSIHPLRGCPVTLCRLCYEGGGAVDVLMLIHRPATEGAVSFVVRPHVGVPLR